MQRSPAFLRQSAVVGGHGRAISSPRFIRPAGQLQTFGTTDPNDPNAGSSNAGAGGNDGEAFNYNDGSGGTVTLNGDQQLALQRSNISAQQFAQGLGLIGSVLHESGTVLAAAITSGGSTQREQIRDQTLVELQRLRAQAPGGVLTGDALGQSAALNSVLAMISAQNSSQTPMTTYLIYGLAALVVAGGGYYIYTHSGSRRHARQNPVGVPAHVGMWNIPYQNPVVTRNGRRFFVPAGKAA